MIKIKKISNHIVKPIEVSRVEPEKLKVMI